MTALGGDDRDRRLALLLELAGGTDEPETRTAALELALRSLGHLRGEPLIADPHHARVVGNSVLRGEPHRSFRGANNDGTGGIEPPTPPKE